MKNVLNALILKQNPIFARTITLIVAMFRPLLNDKIGNIIRYFSSQVSHLSLTKLLKLLYLTDETAMRETGSPVTWLEYRAWKNGPVPADIYQEIKHGEKMLIGNHLIALDDYIAVERKPNPWRKESEEVVYIRPKGEPDFSKFSDYETDLLNRILQDYGHRTATQLVDLLHREGSLWHQVVEKNRLGVNFELYQNTSNCIIDFSDLIEGDELLKMAAQSAFESLAFHKTLYENQLQHQDD